MKTFKEFLQLREGGMWNNPGIQDNPSNPGTKRKDAKDLYNHRFGDAGGGSSPMGNVSAMQPPGNQPGQLPGQMPGKKMKKK